MTAELNSSNFDQEVLKHSGLVLVDFYTEGCGPCRMLTPVLNEIATERGDALKVVKIDAASNYEIAGRYRVSGVPALFIFENGQVQRQLVGLRSKKDLLAWIDSKN